MPSKATWIVLFVAGVLAGTSAAKEPSMALPERLGSWSRIGEPRRIEPAGIFEYMDGAGEMYLAYRFRHLDVVEYASADSGGITVELYRMETADDAWGLLSTDWTGERVSLGEKPSEGEDADALYGAGLLRLRSGDLYARILADNETVASRKAVLDLGRALAAGRRPAPSPALVAALPTEVQPGYRLRRDRTCFLRSHLVLNSQYFVANRNLLGLDRSAEAVTAVYRPAAAGAVRGGGVRLVAARFLTPDAASAALSTFRAAYLPEHGAALARGEAPPPDTARVEEGWLGFRRAGRVVILVFESPEAAVARSFLDRAERAFAEREAPHE